MITRPQSILVESWALDNEVPTLSRVKLVAEEINAAVVF
jgi:hypothetical protein